MDAPFRPLTSEQSMTSVASRLAPVPPEHRHRNRRPQISDTVSAADWVVVHDAAGAASRDESSKAGAPTTIANNANRMSTTRCTAKAASDGSFAAGLR